MGVTQPLFIILYSLLITSLSIVDKKAICKKLSKNKRIKVIYKNREERIFDFSELTKLNVNDIISIHSCEPTLEEIFIELTGEKLNV